MPNSFTGSADSSELVRGCSRRVESSSHPRTVSVPLTENRTADEQASSRRFSRLPMVAPRWRVVRIFHTGRLQTTVATCSSSCTRQMTSSSAAASMRWSVEKREVNDRAMLDDNCKNRDHRKLDRCWCSRRCLSRNSPKTFPILMNNLRWWPTRNDLIQRIITCCYDYNYNSDIMLSKVKYIITKVTHWPLTSYIAK